MREYKLSKFQRFLTSKKGYIFIIGSNLLILVLGFFWISLDFSDRRNLKAQISSAKEEFENVKMQLEQKKEIYQKFKMLEKPFVDKINKALPKEFDKINLYLLINKLCEENGVGLESISISETDEFKQKPQLNLFFQEGMGEEGFGPSMEEEQQTPEPVPESEMGAEEGSFLEQGMMPSEQGMEGTSETENKILKVPSKIQPIKISISVSVPGGYDAFKRFLEKITESLRILDVISIQIGESGGESNKEQNIGSEIESGTITEQGSNTYSIDILTFYYKI